MRTNLLKLYNKVPAGLETTSYLYAGHTPIYTKSPIC